MRTSFITAATVLGSLLLATVTTSAQETKKIEKKVMIVTVEEDGISKDTTIIETDTLEFEGGNLIIDTREGRRIIRKPGEGSRMVWMENQGDFASAEAGPGIRPARAMVRMQEEKEGVSYNISVDGVVVHIRAPKEKAGEADQILSEVKKILMKK